MCIRDSSHVGLKDASVKDAVVLATDEQFALRGAGETLCIDGPGEYEIGDFSLRGIAAMRHIDTEQDVKKSTIYRIEVGDVRLALIGNIAVSYTHLDVYKRQSLYNLATSWGWPSNVYAARYGVA